VEHNLSILSVANRSGRLVIKEIVKKKPNDNKSLSIQICLLSSLLALNQLF